MTEEALRQSILDNMMNKLRDQLNVALNKDPRIPTVGFVLIVYPINGTGECHYRSNSLRREDMIVMLKEQLSQLEGMPYQEGHG